MSFTRAYPTVEEALLGETKYWPKTDQLLQKIKELIVKQECNLARCAVIIMLPLSVAVNIAVIVVLVLEETGQPTDNDDIDSCIDVSNCTKHSPIGGTLRDLLKQNICCNAGRQSTCFLLSLLLSQQRQNVKTWRKLPNLTAKHKLSPALQAYLDVDALAVANLLWIADNSYESHGFENSIINNGNHFLIRKDGMYAIYSQLEVRALGLEKSKTFTHKIIRQSASGTGSDANKGKVILQRNTRMSPGVMAFTTSVLNEHIRLYKGDTLWLYVPDVSLIYQTTNTNTLTMFLLSS